VFTDANTVFAGNALRALVSPFCDPQVGGVAGNQVYLRGETPSSTADGECWYWSFDRLLKEYQSRAGNVVSATGAIYAIRRSLFQPIPGDAMDDFMVSTGVIAQGRRLVFAADALAYEAVAVQADIEYGRKLRIIAQGLRAVQLRRRLLNPWRHGFYAVQLLWHKVLRRLMVIPLLVLLMTSPMMWTTGLFYQAAVVSQGLFYSLSLAGFVLRGTHLGRSKVFAVPFYFCLVNFAALVSLWNMLAGRRVRNWEPNRQATMATPICPKIT
jgi:cellulose synthase/poly-beta-1,6-N-acetylglucosamine synthase-like glycosyltransferase